ncbi:MAG TPA: acetyl-CoA hydrolase/transferase C-terminal domain-containing protein [Burkholderiaceae bacterium]|nr:acetyl-CoA hydrolase/transferase C-terminal domain-containing protein [Burkholderiaceae bacterium]
MRATTDLYRSKLVTLDEALAHVKTDDSIVSALAAAEPAGFLARLHTVAPRVRNVTVATCLPMQPYPFFTDPAMQGHFFHDAWFFTPAVRKAHEEAGTTSYVPNHLHRAGLDRLDYQKPTIFAGTCSPPDRLGYVSLSLSVTYERELMEAAELVILEVNENLPRTYGDTIVHLDDVDFLVESTVPVPELPAATPDAKDLQIGGHIAELIDDGATLQIGIGGIPNAVTSMLMHKRDLAIHTEMFTDGMVDLYEAGCIGKTPHTFGNETLTGKMVGTFALGSRRLYDFLHRNPAVALMRGSWVNNPYVIARNRKQVSINTALEVDLTGQVCSESLGARQFSGTGGQADTAVGAQMSEGGKSFIALYSTTGAKQPDGTRRTVSKITPTLAAGAAVTLHRADVDYVVTEFGAVRLKGAPVRERVRRLVSIAHPDFRAWLQDEAARLRLSD